MKIGKIPENTWKRSVRKSFAGHIYSDKSAGIGRDCALFHNNALELGNGSLVVSEGCIVPFCERMGALGVYLASNAVAGSMASVSGVMISMFLDGRTGEQFVAHVAKEAGITAERLGITISGFDVHILHGIKKPYLISYGVGSKSDESSVKPGPSMDIIVSGFIGLSGSSMILSDEESRQKLSTRFPAKYLQEACEIVEDLSVISHVKALEGQDICYMRALSESGINGALWDLSETAGKGLTADLKSIPVTQETVEICNYFDINPYELHSSGSLLIVSEDGKAVADKLLSAGINAEVIGQISSDNNKLIVYEDEKRFITLPQSDAIYQIF